MCPLKSPQFFKAVLRYVEHDDGAVARDIFAQMSELAKLACVDRDKQMIQYTQRVYERTTLWFVSHGFDQKHIRQKIYLHLVATHCRLSFRAYVERRTSRSTEKGPLKSLDLREIAKISLESMREGSLAGLNGRGLNKRGLNGYLESLGLYKLSLPADYSTRGQFNKDAWLVMMLRGIAWFMSQKARGTMTSASTGGAIPSSCWDNQKPVWII
jgi:hypothetical protein